MTVFFDFDMRVLDLDFGLHLDLDFETQSKLYFDFFCPGSKERRPHKESLQRVLVGYWGLPIPN